MMKTVLTNKEQEVYAFILDFRRDMRFSPSMREIASGVGLYSVSTVHKHVHHLIDKGWLLPVDGGNRKLVPVEDARQQNG